VNVAHFRTGSVSRSGGIATKISLAPMSMPATFGSNRGCPRAYLAHLFCCGPPSARTGWWLTAADLDWTSPLLPLGQTAKPRTKSILLIGISPGGIPDCKPLPGPRSLGPRSFRNHHDFSLPLQVRRRPIPRQLQRNSASESKRLPCRSVMAQRGCAGCVRMA